VSLSAVAASLARPLPTSSVASVPAPSNWLAEGIALDRRLGSADTTAQVHPAQFTAAMMHAAQAQGAELRLALVTGLTRSSSAVSGVETDAGRIECDAIVIAMGP